jgi:hypothetical protein
MCFLCRTNEDKGGKDLWKMRNWYWNYRSKNIYRRGCKFTTIWMNVMDELYSYHVELIFSKYQFFDN